MKPYLLLQLILLGWPFFIQAQIVKDTTCPCLHKDSTIKHTIIRNGKYASVVYTMNDEVLSNKELKAILKTYPASADEIKKIHRQNLVGTLMASSFLAFLIVGSIEVDHQKKVPGSNFEKAPLPFSISLASLVGATALWASNKHFNKAIKAYNNRVIQ